MNNPTLLDNILFSDNVNIKRRNKRNSEADITLNSKRTKMYHNEDINSIKLALKTQYNINILDQFNNNDSNSITNIINNMEGNNHIYLDGMGENHKLAEWIIQFLQKTVLWLHIQTTLKSDYSIHDLISSSIENSIDDMPEIIPNLRDLCKLYISRSKELLEFGHIQSQNNSKTNLFAEQFVGNLVSDVTKRNSIL